jgi:hypothetical protein
LHIFDNDKLSARKKRGSVDDIEYLFKRQFIALGRQEIERMEIEIPLSLRDKPFYQGDRLGMKEGVR